MGNKDNRKIDIAILDEIFYVYKYFYTSIGGNSRETEGNKQTAAILTQVYFDKKHRKKSFFGYKI